jgi:hypothetical protein
MTNSSLSSGLGATHIPFTGSSPVPGGRRRWRLELVQLAHVLPSKHAAHLDQFQIEGRRAERRRRGGTTTPGFTAGPPQQLQLLGTDHQQLLDLHVLHRVGDAAHSEARLPQAGERHPVHAESGVIVDHHRRGVEPPRGS